METPFEQNELSVKKTQIIETVTTDKHTFKIAAAKITKKPGLLNARLTLGNLNKFHLPSRLRSKI